MKKLGVYFFVFLLLPSCAGNNFKTDYHTALWQISNHKGEIGAAEVFRYLRLDVAKYSLSVGPDNVSVYLAKSALPVQKIKISNQPYDDKVDQDIEIVFTAQYCISAVQLDGYDWKETGHIRLNPVHVINSPAAADGVIWERFGYKFVIEQNDGLETTIKFVKPCAEDIYIGRIWQEV